MNKIKEKNLKAERRARRTRAKLFGTAERPRLSVFRSNRYLYAQLIDDERGRTILSASTHDVEKKGAKVEKSVILGDLLAKKAKEKGIASMVFDRGPYRYHGRVKGVAEALRNSGINI